MTASGDNHDVVIKRVGAERLDDIGPLWKALYDHHATLPSPYTQTRTAEESWARRRADYVSWLGDAGTFVLLAEVDGLTAGYAFVRLDKGSTTWVTGERVGSLETLSILPDYRDRGIGSMFMDRIYEDLRTAGIKELSLAVMASNDPAIRFYERQGFAPFVVVMARTL